VTGPVASRALHVSERRVQTGDTSTQFLRLAARSREHSSRSCIARRRSARRLTSAVATGGMLISIYLIPGFG
jgi:hypothetical protein